LTLDDEAFDWALIYSTDLRRYQSAEGETGRVAAGRRAYNMCKMFRNQRPLE
jgi:hypothetical protein